MTTKHKNDCQRVLARLKRGSITRKQSILELGILNITARISDLRKMMGHDAIKTTYRKGETFCRWKLAK